MPDRRSVSEHEQVLDQLLATEDLRAIIESHQEEATSVLQQAIRYGLEREEQSAVETKGLLEESHSKGHDGRVFVMIGSGMHERVNEAWQEQLDSDQDVQMFTAGAQNGEPATVKSVMHALALEVAIVHSVRGWTIEKSGGGHG
jgi:hypothetical protein